MNESNLPSSVPKEDADTKVDAATDAYLRATNIVTAINENLPEGSQLPQIPANYVFKKRDRESVSLALHSAFELTGGVPSLVFWASKNPKDFYALWSRLLPSNTETSAGGVNITFQSAIPEAALDRVTVDETGRVITLKASSESSDDLPE